MKKAIQKRRTISKNRKNGPRLARPIGGNKGKERPSRIHSPRKNRQDERLKLFFRVLYVLLATVARWCLNKLLELL
ncbi:MAG: hypothetical protein QGG42_04325 [Phycisphaerae bacterium]|nr:hypothetical protein [Phycisphaerae bacterium]